MSQRSAALIATLVLVSAGGAQPVPDHLKCYKVKDSRARASYTADLQGLAPEPGCTIKVPGKLLCVETTKTNRQPAADGEVPGNPAGRFVCYPLRCPKAALPSVTWRDQFGAGTLTPKAPKLVCAPEVTTTTATTTTTTLTMSTSTTTTTSSTPPTTCGGLIGCCSPGVPTCQLACRFGCLGTPGCTVGEPCGSSTTSTTIP